jgi:hypothetical protein
VLSAAPNSGTGDSRWDERRRTRKRTASGQQPINRFACREIEPMARIWANIRRYGLEENMPS